MGTLFDAVREKHDRLSCMMDKIVRELDALLRQKEALDNQWHALAHLKESLAQTMVNIERVEALDPPGPAGMLETSP